MLFILFGTTANLGRRAQEYFKTKHGFELVRKVVYIPESAKVSGVYDKDQLVTKEEVDACDFKYENNGRWMGFNFKQFEDAVRGKKDCLLTLSAHNIELINQLKVGYGGYVTVICAYIDGIQLEKLTDEIAYRLKEGEKEIRLEMGRKIKELFIQQRDVFDEMVVYAGEESMFNYKSLEAQFDFLVKKARKREEKLNDENYIDLPYEGREPYIFVSYAHADKADVLPALAIMQRNGCRVWYDKGIHKGKDWKKVIGARIRDCQAFYIFTSKNSLKKIKTEEEDASFVEIELAMAYLSDTPIIAVRLDDTAFPKQYESDMTKLQYVDYREDDFEKNLMQTIDRKILKTYTKPRRTKK